MKTVDDDSDGNGPITWDTEEDHLLSYFLDEGGTLSSGSHNLPTLMEGHNNNNNSNSNSNRSEITKNKMIMPATPAVQFYPSSKPGASQLHPPQPPEPHHYGMHQQHTTPIISNSSSGSSLSSMAATLVHGGPMLRHGPHSQPSIALGLYDTTSPISPAATIGNGQENLMLPPPPRYAVDDEKQKHINWLQHINNMAMQQSMPSHSHSQILPIDYSAYPIAPSYTVSRPVPTVEDEEKRSKRLARNRESARQSRRKKKEHLSELGNKVNQLQDMLDISRRLSLGTMDVTLQEKRIRLLTELVRGSISVNEDALHQVLQETSPNSPVKQSTIRFQYATLKQTLLPKYEEFILWLTLREKAFFTKGKEERAKADLCRAVASTRLSSKQIGEELTKSFQECDDGLECDVDDLAKFWPMFCFEHSISVDQEDKLLQFYKRSVESSKLPFDRLQIADATNMVTKMDKGMSFQAHAVGMRSENTLMRTLTPEQTTKYLDWYANNQERCKKVLRESAATHNLGKLEDARTIMEMCQRLDNALRLPNTDGLPDNLTSE